MGHKSLAIGSVNKILLIELSSRLFLHACFHDPRATGKQILRPYCSTMVNGHFWVLILSIDTESVDLLSTFPGSLDWLMILIRNPYRSMLLFSFLLKSYVPPSISCSKVLRILYGRNLHGYASTIRFAIDRCKLQKLSTVPSKLH